MKDFERIKEVGPGHWDLKLSRAWHDRHQALRRQRRRLPVGFEVAAVAEHPQILGAVVPRVLVEVMHL
jgi:hypothetical protein